MQIGNSYGIRKSAFGGGFDVWRSVDPNGKWQSGGTVANLPVIGLGIAAGSPVELDSETHIAKILKFYKVQATVTTADTVLKLVALDGLPRLQVGKFIGIPAATATGTMTAITVGAITVGDGFDSITITANSLGALAIGDLLVEAAATGPGVAPYCVPNALVYNDVYMDLGDTAATVACVHTGTVYAKRTPFMSQGVKNNLPSIKFDNAF